MSGTLIGGTTSVGGTLIGTRAGAPQTPRRDDDEAEVFAALLPAAAPRARPGFVLTPLADVMFQLLIFFMLSSSLAPYALLPLRREAVSAPAPAPAPVPAAARAPETAAAPVPVWHLGRGEVRAGSERIALEAIGAALEALAGQGADEVLVFTTAAATAGDIATLLEAVHVRRGPAVRARLIGQGG